MDTREFQTIKVEVEGTLGRLILNRPDRLNAIGATMLQELAEAARWFDEHRELRVVIMSGAGRAFCAGADLKDPIGAASAPAASTSWLYRREAGQYGLRAADALEQMRAVTVAQVHGYAVGGGVVLTAVCDLRVVAEDAWFFIPEVDLGLPLAWGGIPRLVRGSVPMTGLVMTAGVSARPKLRRLDSSIAWFPPIAWQPKRKSWRANWPPAFGSACDYQGTSTRCAASIGLTLCGRRRVDSVDGRGGIAAAARTYRERVLGRK